jgi:hypothetical protein
MGHDPVVLRGGMGAKARARRLYAERDLRVLEVRRAGNR